MVNFLISALIDLVLIFISYLFFKNILGGPTRHKIYEKFVNSFGKFVLYTFLISLGVTALTAFIMYRTRYLIYLNIVSPAILSIFIGFIMSTVPTKGIEKN